MWVFRMRFFGKEKGIYYLKLLFLVLSCIGKKMSIKVIGLE